MDFFKSLDPNKDIKLLQFPAESSLYTITNQAEAILADTKIYSIGPFKDSFVYNPDSFGSTSAGITPSGAWNSIAKADYNAYGPAYYVSASGIYSIQSSHSADLRVVTARVVDVSGKTKGSGIWPDSFTGVFSYMGTTLTAFDSSADSFGPNKQSLTFGKLTNIVDDQCVGSITYNNGAVILHGGTGVVGNAFTNPSITGFAFRGSLTGGLSASTTATHIVCETMSFRTYEMIDQITVFCVLEPDEFNYTSNPSAANVPLLQDPNTVRTYITGIALYDNQDNALVVGKISPPLLKRPFDFRVIQVNVCI